KTASVMVWAGVSATGRTLLIFVEKGAKINTEFHLEEVLKKELKGKGNWTSQQDGAPSHKSKKVQRWCRQNLLDFIYANEWLANSPDLNVMDYSVWAILEEKACAKRHSTQPMTINPMDICQMGPPDGRFCGFKVMYTYNKETLQCDEFWFPGCTTADTNANLFIDMQSCEKLAEMCRRCKFLNVKALFYYNYYSI
ncbi:Kunitz/Bovine pancreatic trypsin inhibitor domain protein, partial [Ancylostoma duodenale]